MVRLRVLDCLADGIHRDGCHVLNTEDLEPVLYLLFGQKLSCILGQFIPVFYAGLF
jgi:hypothetical protein